VEKRPLDISTHTGGFDLAVVGESHYQMTLRRLAGYRRQRRQEVVFRAWLLPDTQNPYDGNAVVVVLDDGQSLGTLIATMRPSSSLRFYSSTLRDSSATAARS
jgi:hypothetical protein